MVQFAPAARVEEQPFVTPKSPPFAPVSVMLLIVSVDVPLLVTVTVCAGLVVFSACEPNVRDEGDTEIAVPAPVSVTVCGLPVALSSIVRVADSAPDAVGVKMTPIVHEANAVSEPLTVGVAPQVLVSAKSPGFAPVKVMAMLLSVALTLFVSVTVCDGLLLLMP